MGIGSGDVPGAASRFRREAQHRKKVETILREAPRTGRTLTGRSTAGNQMLTKRHLVLLGLAVVIGVGGYQQLGDSVSHNHLVSTAVGLVLATIAALGAAVCFAELASTVPVGGSAYTYSYAAFGQFTAWTVGSLLLLEYAAGAGVITFGWATFVFDALPSSWVRGLTQYPGGPLKAEGRATVAAVGGMLIVLITAGLYLLDRSRRARLTVVWGTALSVVVKVAFFVAAVLAGAWIALVGPPTGPPKVLAGLDWGGALTAFGVLYFAFIGFDAVGTAADDSRYPPKDLPRATLVTVAISGALYVALLGVIALGIGRAVYDPQTIGPAGTLFRIGALAGLPSGVVILVYGLSRVLLAVRRDGLATRADHREGTGGRGAVRTPAHGTSGRRECLWTGGLTLVGLIVTAGAGFDYDLQELVTKVTNLATASAFAVVAVGTVALRYRRPDLPRTFRAPMLPLVSGVSVVASLALFVINASTMTVAFLVWLGAVVLGLAVQAGLIAWRVRRPPATAPGGPSGKRAP